MKYTVVTLVSYFVQSMCSGIAIKNNIFYNKFKNSKSSEFTKRNGCEKKEKTKILSLCKAVS